MVPLLEDVGVSKSMEIKTSEPMGSVSLGKKAYPKVSAWVFWEIDTTLTALVSVTSSKLTLKRVSKSEKMSR